MIIWEVAMSKAAAVRWAALGRRAYAEGVAYERITIDPNRMSGLPCIRDTRVTVSAVLGQLAAGLSIPELLADFPYLDRADVLAALEFAAAAVQERELPLPTRRNRRASPHLRQPVAESRRCPVQGRTGVRPRRRCRATHGTDWASSTMPLSTRW
jgi:uncharacterized protein (DUF433 family)